MKTVRWLGCVSVLILFGLAGGVVQSQSSGSATGASPVLFLELEMLPSVVVPEDQESNVLILEFNMVADDSDQADTTGQDASTPDGTAQQGPVSHTLVLELNRLGGGEEWDRAGGDSSSGSSNPNVLLLELGALPEDIPEEELTAMLEEKPGMLILELDQMTADALEEMAEGRASDVPERLILELDRIGTDPDAIALQDSKALVLELDQLRDPRTLALATYAPYMIGYWQLDEGAGETVWDYSGHNHNGTLYGDLAWNFDELEFGEGYISVPDTTGLLNPGNALTIAGWVYLDDVERDQNIFGKLSLDQGGYLLRVTGGQLCPIIWNSGEATPDTDVWGEIPGDTWTHLTLTRQANGDMLGYIDGVNVGRIRASEHPIESNPASLIIGANPLDPASEKVEGLLADLRLYNAPLSARAIDALAMGWRSQFWDDVDIEEWEGIDGPSSGGFFGSGATGMGIADFGGFKDISEFMITDTVLDMLEAEGMDPKIVKALRTLQNQRFDDAASQHRFLKAVDKILSEKVEQKKLGEAIGGKVRDHAKVGQEFILTESALNKLSDDVKNKLNKYKDRRFVNGNAFAKMMQLTLGEEEFTEQLSTEAMKIEFAPTDQDLQGFSKEIQQKLKTLRGKIFKNEEALLADVKTTLGDDGENFVNDNEEKLKEAGKKIFKVTDQDLNDQKISQEIRDKLKKLKNQHFDTEKDFSKAMKVKLGEKTFKDNKLSKHATVKKEFIITQEVLDNFKGAPTVKEKLGDDRLKGKLFINEADFTKAVVDVVGDEDFKKHKDQLLKDADKKEIRITNSILKKMADPKIPKAIRKKLKNLQGGPFDKEEDFTKAVKAAIGEKTFDQYQETLKKVHKEVEGKFSIDVQNLEKMKEPKVPDDIRKKLGELKGRSFDNEAAFSKAAQAVDVDLDSAEHQDIKTQVLASAKVSAAKRKTKKARLAKAKASWTMRHIKRGRGVSRRRR